MHSYLLLISIQHSIWFPETKTGKISDGTTGATIKLYVNDIATELSVYMLADTVLNSRIILIVLRSSRYLNNNVEDNLPVGVFVKISAVADMTSCR